MRIVSSISRFAVIAGALWLSSLTGHAGTVSLFGVVGTAAGTPLTVPSSVVNAKNAFLVGVTGALSEEFPRNQNLSDIFGNGSSISGGVLSNTTGAGRFNTSADPNSFWFETVSNTTIQLSSDQKAFGLYLTDYGDFNAFMTLELFNGLAKVYSTNVGALNANGIPLPPSNQNDSVLFFGVHSTDAFNRVVLTLAQNLTFCDPGDEFCRPPLDFIGADSILIGQLIDPGTTVPEPATLLLTGLGLLAAVRAAKKHR